MLVQLQSACPKTVSYVRRAGYRNRHRFQSVGQRLITRLGTFCYTSKMGTNSKEYNRNYHLKRSSESKAHKLVMQRARINRLRAEIREYLLKHPCMDCAESDPIVLDFDHVSDNKTMEISNAMRHGWAISKIMDEIKKCEVVCSNCHRRRTHQRRLTG